VRSVVTGGACDARGDLVVHFKDKAFALAGLTALLGYAHASRDVLGSINDEDRVCAGFQRVNGRRFKL